MKTLMIWKKSRVSDYTYLFIKGRARAIFANILVMIVAALSLASCSDDPDGKWDPMVWKAEVPVQKTEGVYNVSANGAEFTFSCNNYASPWIDCAISNEKTYYPLLETNDPHKISDDWFKAEMSGNKLTVVFEANETAEARLLQLCVTAGDIFYTFKFKQSASK